MGLGEREGTAGPRSAPSAGCPFPLESLSGGRGVCKVPCCQEEIFVG